MRRLQFVLSVCTESCDRWCYIINAEEKPSEEKIEAFLKKEYPEEYRDVGWVSWDINETEAVEL